MFRCHGYESDGNWIVFQSVTGGSIELFFGVGEGGRDVPVSEKCVNVISLKIFCFFEVFLCEKTNVTAFLRGFSR